MVVARMKENELKKKEKAQKKNLKTFNCQTS
jgi:hypothetical protein